MQYLIERRFKKKTAFLVGVLCIAPQLLSSALNFIYSYWIAENAAFPALDPLFENAIQFLSYVSTFAGYAIVAYLVFFYGMRGGGEWIIAFIAAYCLSYFLTFYVGSSVLGLVLGAVLAVCFASVFIYWTKGCHEVSLLIFASMLIPYLGGVAILFATSSVSAESFIYNIMYGFLNLGTDLLILLLAARIANMFRSRAMEASPEGINISISEQILPRKNPVLRTFLLIDLVYSAIALIQAAMNSYSLLSEYGAPVNASEAMTLVSPYITLAVYFVAGYAILLLVGNKIETYFCSSEQESKVLDR